MRLFPPLVLVVVLGSGCIQQIAVRTISDVMQYGFDAYYAETDLEFAREGLAGNLKLLEALIAADPENEELLLLASQGYSAYALAFAEDDSVERARVFYLRGRDYALQILLEKEEFREALSGDLEELGRSLNNLSSDDVPAVFWTAFAWGGYVNITRDDVQALADLPRVLAMMEFVARIEPAYYYGGAHTFLGAINGTMPQVLGGRPDVAKNHFDKALAINEGKFLMTHVYYARTYAVQVQDQALYDSLLTVVDQASLDILPEARLPNAVAKQKAKRLMMIAEELF